MFDFVVVDSSLMSQGETFPLDWLQVYRKGEERRVLVSKSDRSLLLGQPPSTYPWPYGYRQKEALEAAGFKKTSQMQNLRGQWLPNGNLQVALN